MPSASHFTDPTVVEPGQTGPWPELQTPPRSGKINREPDTDGSEATMRQPTLRRPNADRATARLTAGICLLALIVTACLTGCAHPDPTPTPAITATCDSGDCEHPGNLRWSIPAPFTVGVTGTNEHGRILFAEPMARPNSPGSRLTNWWFDVFDGVGYYFDGTTIVIVDADTGVQHETIAMPAPGSVETAILHHTDGQKIWWEREVSPISAEVPRYEVVFVDRATNQSGTIALAQGECVVAAEDDHLVVAAPDHARALTLSGSQRWRTEVSAGPPDARVAGNYVRVAGNTLYALSAARTDARGELVTIDLSTGARVAEVSLDPPGSEIGSLVQVADGVVTFAGQRNRSWWTLNVATGKTDLVGDSNSYQMERQVQTEWVTPEVPKPGAKHAGIPSADQLGLSASSGGRIVNAGGGHQLAITIGCADDRIFEPHSNGAPAYIDDCDHGVLLAITL